MHKPTITILVSPPGGGKSTWAKSMESLGNVRINQDDLGKVGHMTAFNVAIFEQKNIVVDRLNFSKEQRERYLKPARDAGYKTQIIVFHVPFATCFERCMARENHPTISTKESASSALNMFFKSYERVTDYEADVVERLGWDLPENTPRGLIVDLDNTLSNAQHREHHVQKTPDHPKADWKAFFNGLSQDAPNVWCVDLIRAFLKMSADMTPESRPYHLVFASGRPDNYRPQTVEWLMKTMGYKNWDHLFMRPRDSFRPDTEIKNTILDFELRTRYSDLLFIDDRKNVVEMYRSYGFTVLACAPGDF